MSKLILCGGTGVHVGLAYLRLHLVSKYLGNYLQPLPDIFVVDRDTGTSDDSALKILNSLCSNWPEPLPLPAVIDPTPQDASYRINTQIGRRFAGSALANAIFSERQLQIDFSRGMMASPALGAAVFELKSREVSGTPPDTADIALRSLLKDGKTRVAIAASLVGGTGASVAPALTILMAKDHEVCITPLHHFMIFNESSGSDEQNNEAQLSNRLMQENVHSATAYFGDQLAHCAALIPIAVNSTVTRKWTSHNKQPPDESAAHLLAASTFIRHFDSKLEKGLYALSGHKDPESESAALTGMFLVNNLTLETLANRTAALAKTLHTVALLGLTPSIFAKFLTNQEVAQSLANFAALFSQQAEWFKKLKISTAINVDDFLIEKNVRTRLLKQPITANNDKNQLALNIFKWLSQWVVEQYPQVALPNNVELAAFWPKEFKEGTGSATGVRPGDLKECKPSSLTDTLDTARLSANGWPAKNAAESFFKYSLDQKDKVAQRQLEIMLAGLINGSVKLTQNKENGTNLSGLFDHSPEYILSYNGSQIGFTSKYTLLVPKPDSYLIWKNLWEEINSPIPSGSSNWKTDPWASNSKNCIDKVISWFIASKKSCGITIWNKYYEDKEDQIFVPFGLRSEQIIVVSAENFGTNNNVQNYIRLPSYINGDPPPSAEPKNSDQVPELGPIDIYSIGSYFCPKTSQQRMFIWEEHLEKLLSSRAIQNYWISDNELQVEVDNIVVRVLDLLPLKRADVFTKLSRKFQGVANSARFADSPIRWEFYDLLKLDEKLTSTIASNGEKAEEILDNSSRKTVPPVGPTVVGSNVRWSVNVKGLTEPISVVTTVDKEIITAEWLVWPNFKTPNYSWKAYYCYSNSDDTNIVTRALSRKSVGFAETEIPGNSATPVNFHNDTNAHAGGPPFAFCATLKTSNDQFGLFLFELPDKSVSDAVEIAVDFGTSNSAVAWRTETEGGNRNGQAVELLKNTLNPTAGLTFVVLGSLSDKKRDEIAANGSWFPSFADVSGKTLYSELISAPRVSHKADPATYNVPLKHYSIPTSKCIKADETVARDFKWLGNSVKGALFQGQYLTLLLEMALANIIATYGIPTASKLLMLYPIRAEKQLENYDKVVQAVVKRMGISTSIPLSICYLDESRAAFTDPHTNNKIGMVADLGGGTLDIYINGSSELANRPLPIADSILVGGNKLTNCIENSLPPAWNVGLSNDAPKSDSILRRWLRESNMHELILNGKNKTITNSIAGFQSSGDAKACMVTCDNYFNLLAEYIARNLVAYFKDCGNNQLSVDIKLSGNGWRLFYAEKSLAFSFQAIGEKIIDCIRVHCSELKISVPTIVVSKLNDETLKLGSVIDALKATGYTLSEIINANKSACSIASFNLTKNLQWYERAPFAEGTLFEKVTPNFKLYKGTEGTKSAVEASTSLLSKINAGIKGQYIRDGKFDNTSASIWEVLVEEIKP